MPTCGRSLLCHGVQLALALRRTPSLLKARRQNLSPPLLPQLGAITAAQPATNAGRAAALAAHHRIGKHVISTRSCGSGAPQIALFSSRGLSLTRFMERIHSPLC